MAFNFNAGNDTELHCDSTPITGKPFTVSVWVRAATAGIYQCAFSFVDSTVGYYFYLGAKSSPFPTGVAIYIKDTAGEGLICNIADALPDGVWVHLAGTWADDGTVYLWADGVKSSSGSKAGDDNYARMYISDDKYDEEWNGDLCEVAVWDRVLSDDEIKALAKGYSPAFFRKGLKSYWPLLHDYIRDIAGGYEMSSTGENDPTVAAHHRIIYPRPHQILWKTVGGDDHNLTANGLTVGAPIVGQPAITQDHSLSSTALTLGAPALDTPALSQVHELTANGLLAGTPVLDMPGLSQDHGLTADDIVAGAPVLGEPAISQVHALSVDTLTVGTPVLGTPSLSTEGDHALTADPLTVGTPSLGSPDLAQNHGLTADGLLVGTPVLGNPLLVEGVLLTADPLTIGAPVLDNPTLSQIHDLVADALTVGQPVLDLPALSQLHLLAAEGIILGAPDLGTPGLNEANTREILEWMADSVAQIRWIASSGLISAPADSAKNVSMVAE
jgi:hypothetical protein